MSVRETEKKVNEILDKPQKKKVKIKGSYLQRNRRKIKNILGTKVQITKGKKKGKIEIEYYNENDLERILYLLETINKGDTEVNQMDIIKLIIDNQIWILISTSIISLILLIISIALLIKLNKLKNKYDYFMGGKKISQQKIYL